MKISENTAVLVTGGASGLGLAVVEKIQYNLIETFNKYTESKIHVIIAEKCIEKFFDQFLEFLNQDDYQNFFHF